MPRLHVDTSATAHLVSEGDLPGVRLTAADDALFGVYQDWLHQNTGIHTDGVIDEDGKWKAIWNVFCFPTQCYDVPSVWVGKKIVSTLTVELDGIQGWKRNTESVIFFWTVIMKLVRLVTGAKDIRARIDAWLDSWNRGTFDEFLYDSYTVAMGYLGRDIGNQSSEHLQHKLLNLILCGKFCEEIRLFCEWESGRVLLPNEIASNKTVITEAPVATVLEKPTFTPPPPRSTLEVYDEPPILLPCILRRMW